MLIELKFFKNVDALVWIITAQIGQLVNENPARATRKIWVGRCKETFAGSQRQERWPITPSSLTFTG